MERVATKVKWLLHKCVESLPAVLVFVTLSQFFGFVIWVVKLDKRVTVLETIIAKMEERTERIVQALDSTYEELQKYMREHR